MTSITINSGAITNGEPGGRKNEKKCSPCLAMAMAVTPTKITAAMAKVTAMWLVKVKL